MVTGASTADLALILVDARKGILEQSRRHAFLASLLRVPHLVLCVNKMDLVDLRPGRVRGDQVRVPATSPRSSTIARPHLHPDLGAQRRQRRRAFRRTCRGTRAPRCCTTSRTCTSRSDRNLIDCRFPVQYVIRPMSDEHHDYRGYAGHGRRRRVQARRRGHRAAVGLHDHASRRSTPSTARSARRCRRCRSPSGSPTTSTSAVAT